MTPPPAAAMQDLRGWIAQSLAHLRQEAARSADTHLLKLTFPGFPGIDFYFKDEAAHPTGSLKHRLARSLYLYALCNGRLRPGQPVVDASSGSTAISEAWFARLLGLEFTAVMPVCTAPRAHMDRLRRGHWRHLGHDRSLPALPQPADRPVCRRSSGQRVHSRLART